MRASRRVMLVVLDGFGIGQGGPSDAAARAHAPFLEMLRCDYPSAQLTTSGEAVGLPTGQMGNSEVGHMTMGAGRVIEQDITRISRALERGEFDTNPAIQQALRDVEQGGGTLHLLGLVSNGGIHSHQEHLYEILESCGRRGIPTAVHAILDGRDTPPRSGLSFLQALLPRVERAGSHLATVMGRFYAMDRDQHWERIELAYRALVSRKGRDAPDALAALEGAYARNEGDEFVTPTVLAGGRALEDGDAILFFNFRSDRARELTNAITGAVPARFAGKLDREHVVSLSSFVCFTKYDAEFDLPVAFSSVLPQKILAEIVAEAGLAQLRIAETEKYAHVTFFFNNGLETPFPAEERILIPSPREVATYDHKPEMSAQQVTRTLIDRIQQRDYAFTLVNFANPDMVGHTGDLPATLKAVETVDRCLNELSRCVLSLEIDALITADHGNCELMVDPRTGAPHTAHTTNPVPIYWLSPNTGSRQLRDGTLADLAPTVLELLDLPIPDEMTGSSLIR